MEDKMKKMIIGDTVTFNGKQAILEGIHKDEAVVYVVEERERYLVKARKLRPCGDKYQAMTEKTD